jgi:UDP-glucose 4-epimerase
MNILLTGGNGFIGNYFQNNYGDSYNISTFSFRNDDINKLDLKNIDTIVHLSALVHQMGGASKEAYFKINVNNTLELAKKAKKANVKQFVFMSSVKVYGEESDTPYTETTKCEPQDDYGLSKLAAENKLKDMEDTNFTISILRTPIVYGYGVKANIENLINLVNKVPILPFSNIQNRRSMVYIGNLCHLLDTIIRQQSSGIFLAADDQALSTSKFISMISKASNKNCYLIQIPFFESLLKLAKPSFHKRLYESLEINNQASKTKLNFKNIYTTKEGIKHMIHGENR